MKKPHAILTAALAGLALSAPIQAQTQTAADKWNYSLMPYLWLPGVSGTLKYGPPSGGSATANVNVDAEKLLDAFDFGLMLEGEARKGRWLIGADLIYLKLSSAKSGIRDVDFNPGSGPVNVANTTINAGTDVELKGTVFTLAGGYALL